MATEKQLRQMHAAKTTKVPQLIITHTWDPSNHYINGTCGHTYEVIDYAYYFNFCKPYKGNLDIKIILPEVDLEDALKKYTFTEEEKDWFRSIVLPRKNIIKTDFLLITDGNLKNFNVLIRAEIMQFMCNKADIPLKGEDNDNIEWAEPLNAVNQITLLGDKRIYRSNNEEYPFDFQHYTKKILLSKIDFVPRFTRHYDFMMYLTSNCKKLSHDQLLLKLNYYTKEYEEYADKYVNTDGEINIIIFSDYLKIEDIPAFKDCVTIVDITVPTNVHWYDFDTYVYTDVQRQFDCSNRLIPECLYNKKNVIVDTSYFDKALDVRYDDAIININKLDLEGDELGFGENAI